MEGPDSLATALRSLVCVAVLPAGLILRSAEAVLLALLGAPRSRVDRVYRGFANFCLAVGGTRLEVHGLEHIAPERDYVVVPNHESNWDPVGLIAGLPPLSIRFVIKRQIMRIPIFGNALRLTGNITVDRASTGRDIQVIRSEMATRSVGSMLFYAEGTRSRDGALHEFKKGAFATAITYGLPVLPVGHAGAYGIWKPETPWIRRGAMVIEVGPPIEVEGMDLAERDKLREQAREVVTALRTRARERVRELGYEPGGID